MKSHWSELSKCQGPSHSRSKLRRTSSSQWWFIKWQTVSQSRIHSDVFWHRPE